uniref:DNA primase/polymerase bifunctional N-terminal domain-containing protein n=1 Tax=Cyanothece sp. (strain PCC 7425 / ATCC 29141) TaxID=395961 RepID=B8HJL8_CYAP4
MYYFPTTLQESIQDLLSSDSRLYATKPPYEEFQQSLSRLPDYAKFTPVKKGKLPYQDEPLTAVEVLERHYNDSCFTGVGLLTGEASGGLVAVDHDGHSADEVLKELAGCPPEEALPPTLHWTSGRTGRYQMLYPVSKETREV